MIYVATQNNSVYAFDADATAANPTTLWKVNLGAFVPKYDNEGVSPNVGILSTPVIDATTNTMYVVAEVNNTSPPFWLHALDVTTGADKMTPVGVTGSYAGDTLEPSCYQRMGLALNPVTNWIYIAFRSCTHGWIFAYDKPWATMYSMCTARRPRSRPTAPAVTAAQSPPGNIAH